MSPDEKQATEDLTEEAKAALESMTPEDYLDLMNYIKKLESNLPEAPASFTFRTEDEAGWNVQMTMRDADEFVLLDRYNQFRNRIAQNGIRPEGSFTAPAPAPVQQTQAQPTQQTQAQPEQQQPQINATVTSPKAPDLTDQSLEVFEVSSLNHLVSEQGSHYLQVKGGRWKKFGWKAWPEIVPEGYELTQFAIGQDTAPPVDFELAYVNRERKKIVAFARKA